MHLLVIRSSEAHSRRRECLLSVDQHPFRKYVFRSFSARWAGRVYSWLPLSPRASLQAARGRKYPSCLLRSIGHAPERGRFCRKSRLFMGRCVDVHSLTDRQACRQYRFASVDGKVCTADCRQQTRIRQGCGLGHTATWLKLPKYQLLG